MSALLHKVYALFIEGKGIRGTCKKAWKLFWKEMDFAFGIIAREIMKSRTQIQKNKIFFQTQQNCYTCNPKYVCEELLKRGLDVDLVWRAPPKGRGSIPTSVRAVKAGSFDYYKEMFTSNVIVTNALLFKEQGVFLKKGQTLIETWHGSLGIKRFGKSNYKGDWRWIRAAILTGKMTKYCVSNSSFETAVYRDTYWDRSTILELGHPRNDLLCETSQVRRENIYKEFCGKYEIPVGTRFVMYAPTFRDSKNFECYSIDFEKLTFALKKRFGGEWCVLLRYHPTLNKVYKAEDYLEKSSHTACVLNVTAYPDIQELIAITDIAITDYSSWIYDFLLLRRPGFIFATDIDEYYSERGFYYPLQETPFSIATNNDELTKNVLEHNDIEYLQKVELFLSGKGCIEDGHASERVADLIMQVMDRSGK